MNIRTTAGTVSGACWDLRRQTGRKLGGRAVGAQSRFSRGLQAEALFVGASGPAIAPMTQRLDNHRRQRPGSLLAGNMRRMAAAYRLRLARRAEALGAEPPHWDGKTSSIDEEERSLLAEDNHRIVPYPFPGLRSFDPGEGEIFFGRDRNVEAVRDLLARNRVVAVLGGSGSGKSSLLRAGLLPFLNTKRRIQGRFGNWYSTEFRPRTKPLDELASALAEQLMLPLLRMSANGGAWRRRLGFSSDVSREVDEDAALRLRGASIAGSPTRSKMAGRPSSTHSPTSPSASSTARTTSSPADAVSPSRACSCWSTSSRKSSAPKSPRRA